MKPNKRFVYKVLFLAKPRYVTGSSIQFFNFNVCYLKQNIMHRSRESSITLERFYFRHKDLSVYRKKPAPLDRRHRNFPLLMYKAAALPD